MIEITREIDGAADFELGKARTTPLQYDATWLDCSLKRLFDRYIGQVVLGEVEPDAVTGGVIAYDCVDRGYRFRHSASAPYVTAEVYELFGDEAETADAAAAA